MSGPHHDPSNRALLEQIEQRTLDLQARIGSLERYVTALVNDRATQRKLVDHAIRLVAQKEALLAAIGRQALDARQAPPVLRDEVKVTPPEPCKHDWAILTLDARDANKTLYICRTCKSKREGAWL